MNKHGIKGILAAMAISAPAMAQTPSIIIPPGNPPPIDIPHPAAKMLQKDTASAALGTKWRNRTERHTLSEDGTVLWTFGLSQPSVVCSPLAVCDLALQPGEIVQSIEAGDKQRWRITPDISGTGSEAVTHIAVKPSEAGLVMGLMIYTNRRTYSVKCISTANTWTAKTGFTYQDDTQDAWKRYHETAGASRAQTAGPAVGGSITLYRITGDNPGWRPTAAYTDGRATYIQFPENLAYGDAPALLALNDDGGLFSGPSERTVIFSPQPGGNVWRIDGVEPRLELVSGVGDRQVKVELRSPK
jgi:type IV secretion system protein TrbG